MQCLYVGPYDSVGEAISTMQAFAESNGLELAGRHHDVYLSDPRLTVPEKLKTVLRRLHQMHRNSPSGNRWPHSREGAQLPVSRPRRSVPVPSRLGAFKINRNGCSFRPESATPQADCLVGNADAVLGKQAFDISEAQGEPIAQPHGVAKDQQVLSGAGLLSLKCTIGVSCLRPPFAFSLALLGTTSLRGSSRVLAAKDHFPGRGPTASNRSVRPLSSEL